MWCRKDRNFFGVMAALSLLLFSPGLTCAQDLTLLGGDLTTTLTGHNGIQAPAPNLKQGPNRLKQVEGFQPFHARHKKKHGVGPLFINGSCGGCHKNNGRGNLRRTDAPRQNAVVIKVALEGLQENGAPINVPGVGDLLQDRTTKNKRKTRFRKTKIRWRSTKVTYPDGKTVRLRRPLLRVRVRGFAPSQIGSSIRMTPGIVGVGLLEAIPEEEILSWSDPDDADSDGISGRPQYVPEAVSGDIVLGRFGFRSSQPTVIQQSAGAAFGEMGMTTSLFNNSNEAPEISDEVLEKIDLYQRLAGVPNARDQENETVQRGKGIFQQIRCHDCHKFNIVTSSTELPELDGQLIHPFTDLLLHDMGEGLSDTRPEFEASGSEWRTTPLWGIGFLPTVSRIKQRYLHDGRARTLEEAILWHGGEAEESRNQFMNLEVDDREALIEFLRSL